MDSLMNLPRPEPFGDDWRDGDGILRCGVCGEPKEAYIETIGRIQPVTCSCDKRKREDAEKKEAVTRAVELLHKSPLYDPSFDSYSLRDDDSPNSDVGKLVRAYIEKWDKLRDASCGLMFSGPCGTGKTFYCAGICNALRKQGVKTIMFPAARFIMAMRGNDAQEVIDSLRNFDLVAIDDFGAQRDTPFAVEQMQLLIDARERSKKPLFVTTNMSKKDFDAPEFHSQARIYDRLLKVCSNPVILAGESRRAKEAQQRRAAFREILGTDFEVAGQNSGKYKEGQKYEKI